MHADALIQFLSMSSWASLAAVFHQPVYHMLIWLYLQDAQHIQTSEACSLSKWGQGLWAQAWPAALLVLQWPHPLSWYCRSVWLWPCHECLAWSRQTTQLCSQLVGTLQSLLIAIAWSRIMVAPVSLVALIIPTTLPDGSAALPAFIFRWPSWPCQWQLGWVGILVEFRLTGAWTQCEEAFHIMISPRFLRCHLAQWHFTSVVVLKHRHSVSSSNWRRTIYQIKLL